ncbi:MAG: lysophospholipid acyltransferase family protein, partial [Bacteroidia bacterium]|nr:lysophospholipid acyltransferase family protein [Bacteroidia bacterium]
MCDMFLEMIKSITISEKQLVKRFIIKNTEEVRRLEALNKSVVVMYGHYASYEWSVVVGHYLDYKGYAIYKPIKNKNFDNLVKRIRSKYNVFLISSKEAVSKIVESETQNIRSVTAFLSDQSPKSSKRQHWVDFMGVKVPCFTGAEVLAKKLNLSVSFLKISKVKRGYYEAEFEPLADDPTQFPDYEITDKFTKVLEAQIREAPEYYLWTHKRWKHRLKKGEAIP